MRYRSLAGAGVLSLALAIGFSHTAFADELSPEQAVAVAESATSAQGAPASTEAAGVSVSLPTAAKPQAAAIATDGSMVTLEPVLSTSDVSTVGGKTVTTLDAPSSSVVTEPVADGLRSLIVVSAPEAPTRYDFDLGLPDGVSARVLSEGAVVFEKLGEEGTALAVGGIDAPWAKDANGVNVPTHFELNGAVLTQVVEHQGAAYPVTADPKLTYGVGVYLNLWGYEANAVRYVAGGAISALTVYGCLFSKLPTGIPGAVIKLLCAAGGSSTAIAFLQELINGQGNFNNDWCYQTRIVPPNNSWVPLGNSNCS